MLKRIADAKKDEDGFTLVELLVVIVILAILAGIVVFSVGGITDKGEASACKTDYETLITAEEAHFAKTTPSAYTNEVGLVNAKLLASASKKYDVAAAGGTYTITVDALNGSTCPANPL